MGSGRGTARRAMTVSRVTHKDLIEVTEEPVVLFTRIITAKMGEEGEVITSHLEGDGTVNYGVRLDNGEYMSNMGCADHLPDHERRVGHFLTKRRIMEADELGPYVERDILGKVVVIKANVTGVAIGKPAQVVDIIPREAAMEGMVQQQDLRLSLYFYSTNRETLREFRLDQVELYGGGYAPEPLVPDAERVEF